MHAWMWGYMYPDLMDGLIPIASQPIAISGRNWIQRRIAAEAIRQDPGWNNGNYEKNPTQWVVTAPYGFLQTSNVRRVQELAPTREAGDALYFRQLEAAKKRDANDTLWGIEAVMDYNPAPHLEKIKARLMAINSGDDETNPPQLGVTEREIKRIPNAKYVLVPASEKTYGHFTHLHAEFWKEHVAQFLKELPPQM
jgi:homoserine O-acetyltransferase/O-succinyltransferase